MKQRRKALAAATALQGRLRRHADIEFRPTKHFWLRPWRATRCGFWGCQAKRVSDWGSTIPLAQAYSRLQCWAVVREPPFGEADNEPCVTGQEKICTFKIEGTKAAYFVS